MRDRRYTDASLFLAQYFGSTTTHAVEIRALPNERGAGRAAPLFTRDPSDIEVHCKRWDSIGRAVYFGTATRLLGHGSGKREDLAELPGLWADIDCAKLGLDKGLVAHTIGSDLYIKPSVIIDSGYGIHGHWLFREALDIRLELDGAANLEADILAALKQLAGVVAGDIAVCDLARVMRLPGTHNTKLEQMVPAHVLEASWARYEYQEVLEWLDWQRPVLQAPKGAGGDSRKKARPAESDAFARYAATAGIKPPIDVGARLAAMEHLGVGDGSIHQTQLHVSASMVAHGADDEAIVALLMAATHEAGGLAGEHWNWAREEKNVRAMIGSARAKFEVMPKAEPQPTEEPAQSEPEAEPAEREQANAKVVNLAEQRQARGRPRKEAAAKDLVNVRCGEAVIGWWQQSRGRIATFEADQYTYAGGLWAPWTRSEHHILRCEIQRILKAGQIDPTATRLNAIYRYVIEHPDLLVEGIEWNATGYIVCQDGALKPRSDGAWETIAHSPDHWATSRFEARIADMGQGCPNWLRFLESCFSDRGRDDQALIVSALREWFGSALIHGKPRELRKALWLHGPSRTGKTRILEVLRGLVGEPTCALKIKDITEDKFGPQSLLYKRAWIADDAVGEGDSVNDAVFKVIVTGEAFEVPRKNLGHAHCRLDIPVAFSSNMLPKVKDQSDGVYNRSIIIQMNVVRSEEETAGKPLIEEVVQKSELAGVLAWGLEGWAPLMQRGLFIEAASMRDARQSFQDDNNPTLAWSRQAVEEDDACMIDKRDIYCSFKGWYAKEHGRLAPPTESIFFKRLRPLFRLGKDYQAYRGQRFLTGIKLTEDGLIFRDECPRYRSDEPIGSGATDWLDVNQTRRGTT